MQAQGPSAVAVLHGLGWRGAATIPEFDTEFIDIVSAVDPGMVWVRSQESNFHGTSTLPTAQVRWIASTAILDLV